MWHQQKQAFSEGQLYVELFHVIHNILIVLGMSPYTTRFMSNYRIEVYKTGF